MAAVSSEGVAIGGGGVGGGGGKGSAATWRNQVMVGELPPDFLRIMITPQQVRGLAENVALATMSMEHLLY